MTFATILREAGICQKLYPNCGKRNIVLFEEEDDGNEFISTEDDVHFAENLLKDNPNSFDKFVKFIDDLESNSISDSSSINIYISEMYVIVFYKTSHPLYFRRKHPDPLDSMD